MEKLKIVFDNFISNYTDSEGLFKTGDLESQVQILLKEGIFKHLLEQVVYVHCLGKSGRGGGALRLPQ